jgi:N-methylhydantoinase A
MKIPMAEAEDRFRGVVAGIDVGGTFTDLIVLDSESGGVRIGKVPTTPDDQSRAVLSVISQSGYKASDIDLVIHGTTTTTNALLERRLAKAGLITTRGFRDVIELGRRTRPQPYGMVGSFVPLCRAIFASKSASGWRPPARCVTRSTRMSSASRCAT